jgi:hypothetical protein
MPVIRNPQLTLTREGSNLKINVTYQADFNTFERRLVGLGLKYRQRIAVIGVDPPGATTGNVLAVSSRFPNPIFLDVTDGVGKQTVAGGGSEHGGTIIVSRAELDEDAIPNAAADVDPDEIRCRIRIEAFGLPPAVTPDTFTDQEVLGGVFQLPKAAQA